MKCEAYACNGETTIKNRENYKDYSLIRRRCKECHHLSHSVEVRLEFLESIKTAIVGYTRRPKKNMREKC